MSKDIIIPEMDRRAFLKRVGIGSVATAFALASVKPTLAKTVLTDKYVKSGEIEEIISKSATVVVGKSGAVDYITTDYGSDDACIQAAIDYVDGLGGGSVLIREGVYLIPTTITLNDNIHLVGTGNGTILRTLTDCNFLITLEAGTAIAEHRIHTRISNMKLDGDRANNSAGGAIYAEYVQEFSLDNLWITDFSDQCCYFVTCKKFIVMSCLFGGSTTANESTALRIATGGDIDIVGNRFHDCPNDAFILLTANTEKTNITGNSFYSGHSGILMGSSAGIESCITISSNNFSDLAEFGISCNQITAVGNNIVDNTFRTIGTNAISVRGSYWNISGNYVYNPANENLGGDNNFGIRLRDSTQNCIVSNNRVIADNGFMTYAIGSSGSGADYIQWLNNPLLSGYSSSALRKIGSNSITQNNHNLNPVGSFTAPAVPATTVNYVNTYGYPCQIQIYAGTVTEIDIDDIATGLTSGIFVIPPSGTINITYSAAPSWRWWGL